MAFPPPYNIQPNPGETPLDVYNRFNNDYHSDDKPQVMAALSTWVQRAILAYGPPPGSVTMQLGETPQMTQARYASDYHSDDKPQVMAAIAAWIAKPTELSDAGVCPIGGQNIAEPPPAMLARFLADYHSDDKAAVLTSLGNWANGIIVWPAKPSRDRMVNMRVGFQGLKIKTRAYGEFPAFGPEITSLPDDDIRSYCQQVKAAGFDAVEFAVSWQYDEISYQYPVPGIDLSGNIPELARRIAIAVQEGMVIDLRLAGDGEGAGPGYNDPGGWTYGREWLMNNFPRIWSELKAAHTNGDVTDFIRPCPGYDAVWYGWISPQSVKDWWRLCRVTIGPDGVQAIEYVAGICHLGDGAATYSSEEGLMCDVFMHEYKIGPFPPGDDTIWQVGKRMLGYQPGDYVRPPDQPADDDTAPENSWLCMTPRGMQVSVAYEYDTYAWVRNEISAAQVQLDAQYLRDCGWKVVC